eukprot:m.47698 g.47698  ORF g.47698 m.47698 type:complete len:424 (-) comp6920_c0_seq1:217-1488(-)
MASFRRGVAWAVAALAAQGVTSAQAQAQCEFEDTPPTLSLPCRFYVPMPADVSPDYINLNGDLSECGITRDDERIDICGGTFDVIHTWTIQDSRQPSGIRTITQTIHVTDSVAPVLVNLPETEVHYCPDWGLPAVSDVVATDACSGAFLLPVTEWQVDSRTDRQYAAQDDCGNRAIFTQKLYPDGSCVTPSPTAAPVQAVRQPGDSTTDIPDMTDAPDATVAMTTEDVGDIATTEDVGEVDIDEDDVEQEENRAPDEGGASTRTGKSGKKGGRGSSSSYSSPVAQEEDRTTDDGSGAVDNDDSGNGSGGSAANDRDDTATDASSSSGKKKKKSKKSKSTKKRKYSKGGSSLQQLNASTQSSIAVGVVASVMVVAAAVIHVRRRVSVMDDDGVREPLIRGASDMHSKTLLTSTDDGFTYAYHAV